MKLALIGNCSYQALIDDRASVRWLCWPRFDSSFVFGALLDEKKGGEFAVEPTGDYETTQAYIPNTNILQTTFTSAAGSFEVLDFAPRFKQNDRSYKPNMLVRRLRVLSGNPTVRVKCTPTYDYAREQPDGQAASNHIEWSVGGTTLRLTTTLPLTYVGEGRDFVLEGDAYVVLTWGAPLEAAIEETCERFLSRTKRYWETWVKHTALPGCFQKEVLRSALALKLHQYEDTGAITAATTTSLPEYPGAGRNWDYRFCWLRDSYFTLRAMRRLGHFEETEAFLSFLKNVAERSPGELQPVFAISGETRLDERILEHLEGYRGNTPVRAGNAAYKQIQNDVYGEMIAALAPFFLDVRFGDPTSTKELVDRLLETIDQTMMKKDAGIWEIRGDERVHTFSLLMHWVGAVVATRIGQRIGDAQLEGRASGITARLREIIEEQCFHPDKGFYSDSIETDNPDAALLMMVNLGFLPRGHRNAESHVRNLAKHLLVNDYLMQRYNHHDGIGDTHATFTVCGFWYAEALARLGHTEEAKEVCEKLVAASNHVGLLSEDINPTTLEQLGNFPQTYSHVGLINAAFAISPMPAEVGDP